MGRELSGTAPRRPADEELFGSDADFQNVACPACGSADTRLQSLFGGAASEALFSCRGCRSCFAWVKWRRLLPGDRPPGRPGDQGRVTNER
jgi:hypothetical protein